MNDRSWFALLVGASVYLLLLGLEGFRTHRTARLKRLQGPGLDGVAAGGSQGQESSRPGFITRLTFLPFSIWRNRSSGRGRPVKPAGRAATPFSTFIEGGTKTVTSSIFILASLPGLFLFLAGEKSRGIFLAVLGGAVGYLFPRWLEVRKESATQAAIEQELPLMVELLNLCIKSGMNLAAALEAVAPLVEGSLAPAVARLVQEIRLGRGEAEALRSFAARVESPEVVSFVSYLVNGLRLGMPISDILESQVARIRRRVRRRVESRLNALPLKLTLCSMFFFLPPLAILVILPNLLILFQLNW